MKTTAFIGTGKMGGALACCVIEKIGGKNVILADSDLIKAKALAQNSGAEACDTISAVKNAKYIFLGVKPQVIEAVANEIKSALSQRDDRFVIVSMLAGTAIQKIEALLGDYPIIRIMPNTPVSVGEGMLLYSKNDKVTEKEIEEFKEMLSLSGDVMEINENLIDAASAVSGSGPAFVYMLIEAMADGGTLCGLPRDISLRLAKQTFLGAAKLSQVSGKHPGELKDDVCSPGGTTIEGVKTLEENAVRGAVIKAVKATFEKTKKL